MKKDLLKVISMLCVLTVSAPMVACGGSGDKGNAAVDKTKAQLYVSNYDGGIGSDWLRDEVIPRFQEEFAEKEFIPGTKGVQVWVTPHRKGLADIGPKLSTAKEEIYFLEDVNYYQGIAEGYFLDITDIVTQPLTAYGETQSIEDKLYEDQVEFYKAPNGKYYGLPHSQSPTLLTYDADLFEENGLYFGADGKLGKKSTDALSNGPDGKPNTYDDGMPATYAQFFELCERMTKRGIAPMIWSGAYPFYSTDFSIGLRADFEGAEAGLAYSFEGTATHLVAFDENGKAMIDKDGNITYRDPVEITVENGYEVFTSAGYYYAYSFMETIYKNHYYSDYSFNEGVSHEGAQDYFLLANKDNDMEDIGMIVEGVYWVNEAKQTFKDMASYPNSSLQERNLKIMPMPKATEAQIGETPTFMDSLNHLAFISAYIDEEKEELAKTFLQYCETQKSLENFLLNTNLTRCYNVDYSKVYDSLSPYTKSLLDTFENARYFFPASSKEIFQKNYNEFSKYYDMGTPAKGRDPMWTIKDEGYTALDLFYAKKAQHTKENWLSKLN